MADKSAQKFNYRALTSVMTAVSFVCLSTSGIVLYFTPRCRVADWSGWHMMGLTKDQWSGLHMWFAVVFVVAGICHTTFNWNVLLTYFRNKLSKRFALKAEWLVVALCTGLLCLGIILEVPPFSSLLAINDSIKNSWEVPATQAPVAHAELLTLAQIAEHVDGIEAEAMVENLGNQGITVASSNVVIGDIAEERGVTPHQIYILAVGEELARQTANLGRNGLCRGGTGTGLLSLRQYCEKNDIDPNFAVKTLESEGYSAETNMLLRDIAHAKKAHVSDILDILHAQ